MAQGKPNPPRAWTFLSNHAHVLVCVAEQPDVRIRDIATRVGITERAASNIVSDLELDGYITRERFGRNNHYALHRDLPLRHPIEHHRLIGDLLELLANPVSNVDEISKHQK